MKKTSLKIIVLCGILGLGLAGIAIANGALDGGEPAMMVSPSTIVLAKVGTITVHTNILAVDVDIVKRLYLDGVADIGLGVDNCGHIVGKFSVADLALKPADEVELTLTGTYLNAESFIAIDVVRVK
jgi:hypothetical protein